MPARFWSSAPLLLLGACAPAAPPASVAPPTWPMDSTALVAAVQASAEAWNRGDLDGHLAIYVDSATFMTRLGPRTGVAATRDAFERTYFRGGRPIQQLRFENLAARPAGRDAALLTGRFVLEVGGEPVRAGWFTLVWLRTPRGWRVVHDHTSG